MSDSLESVQKALNKFIEQTITFIRDEDDVGALNIAALLTNSGFKSAAHLLRHHKFPEDLNDAARSPGTLLEAAIFALVARHNLATGKIIDAIENIIKANRRLGSAKTTKSEIKITKNKTSNRLRNAAKARMAKLDPIKEDVRRSLIEKRPEEGWKSIAQAASAIEPDLKIFRKANNIELSDENGYKLLVTWIGEKDSQLRNTFLDNASAKARSRLTR